MSVETCQVKVGDGWRNQICRRPIKRDGMCGIHAAAKDRRERNAVERAAKYAEQRRLDQERTDRRAAGEAALDAVERVRALADKYAAYPDNRINNEDVAADIRAALADPARTQEIGR